MRIAVPISVRLLTFCVLMMASGCDDSSNDNPPTPPDRAEAPATGSLNFSWDFSQGNQGWQAGFAEYPVGGDRALGLVSRIDPQPPPGLSEGGAFFIGGTNFSADLFMYLVRQLSSEDGILPNQPYRVRLQVTLATSARSGCAGIGGPPGESVYLKAGAVSNRPERAVDENGKWQINIDKGNQASEGESIKVISNIANGLPCTHEHEDHYVSITRALDSEVQVQADSSGNIFLIIGTDSGFEGRTNLYYQHIEAGLEPL